MKTNNIILGIYEVHNASAAIIVNGEVIAAAHEERFTGIKNDVGFPDHPLVASRSPSPGRTIFSPLSPLSEHHAQKSQW